MLLIRVLAQIIKNELSAGVKENEICIVAPSWYRIWQFTNLLRKLMPSKESKPLIALSNVSIPSFILISVPNVLKKYGLKISHLTSSKYSWKL